MLPSLTSASAPGRLPVTGLPSTMVCLLSPRLSWRKRSVEAHRQILLIATIADFDLHEAMRCHIRLVYQLGGKLDWNQLRHS